MNVVITGADGFLGSRLADWVASGESGLGGVRSLTLVDARAPAARADPRVRCLAADLTAPGAAARVVAPDTDVLFHLAAVVSGQAEADFDLGMRVNLDATRALLEAARARGRRPRFVLASTVGVFGGPLPAVVGDGAAVTPQTSYGAAKAMGELLVSDYSRRGWVDGRVARLPTVSVRAGAANAAVTSFASGLVREPLAGLPGVVPVPATQRLWLSSPCAAVRNLAHAGALPAAALGVWPVVNLPGLAVAVGDMVAALETVAGKAVAARVRYEPDETIARMVASFPAEFDNSRALALGFGKDKDFEEIIRNYIRDDLKGVIAE